MADNWIAETRNRLAERRAKKPDTKAGQIWALWPEIKAALNDGQSLKTIRKWLEEDADIAVSLTSLTSYISRNRKREAAQQRTEAAAAFMRAASVEGPAADDLTKRNVAAQKKERIRSDSVPLGQTEDPVTPAMKALNKPRFDIRKVHGDGDPSNQNLI